MLGTYFKSIFHKMARGGERHGVCPDLEVLAAFVDNNLPAQDRDRLNKHLVQCDDCLARVIVCSPDRRVADAEEKAGLVDVIIRFLENSSEVLSRLADVTVSPVPLAGALRGEPGDDPHVVRFTRLFDTIHAEFEVKRLEEDGCEIKARLLKDGQPLNDVRVSLVADEIELESHLTENGGALFETRGFDRYRVIMKKGVDFIGEIYILIQNDS